MLQCPECGGALDPPAASEDGDVGAWCPACVDFTFALLTDEEELNDSTGVR